MFVLVWPSVLPTAVTLNPSIERTCLGKPGHASHVKRCQHMPVIHIGSSSEYIKIDLPPSYSKEGWAQAVVEVAVCGFQGRVEPWVEAADFESFTRQLRSLYESLQGEASFKPREGQFTIKLVGMAGGHIEVTGEAWSKATYENKLEYVLQLDQSFLAAPLRDLEDLLAAVRKKGGSLKKHLPSS